MNWPRIHLMHLMYYMFFTPRKALPGFFLCIFSSFTCLKKLVFSKRDLLRWKVPARLYWDLLTSGKDLSTCPCPILKAYGSYAFVEQNFRFSFKKSKFKCPHPTTSSWELVSWTYLLRPSPTHTTNRCENLKFSLTFLNDCSSFCIAKRRIPMGQLQKWHLKQNFFDFQNSLIGYFKCFSPLLLTTSGFQLQRKSLVIWT
jgi:hypothetical protein